MLYQVSYNPTRRVALVQADAAAVPVGSVDVGSFSHPDGNVQDSVIVYHGVRDLLYKRSKANPANTAMFPNNITDMQNVIIQYDTGIAGADFVIITGLAIDAGAATVAALATLQLTLTVTPSNATDQGVVWASSDPTKATVNQSGLVTGVAAGTTTITATDDTGLVVAEAEITVTA